jgi:anti-anti-sigma factor
MAAQFTSNNDWFFVPAPGRLDAFNFEDTKRELEDAAKKTKQIAIDVSSVHFVSIPMIKFIHSLASEVARKGGRLALVGPTEKLKRQIHIFASLDPLVFYSQENWEKLVNTNLEGQA